MEGQEGAPYPEDRLRALEEQANWAFDTVYRDQYYTKGHSVSSVYLHSLDSQALEYGAYSVRVEYFYLLLWLGLVHFPGLAGLRDTG